jgi:hypothetical protein
MRSTTIRWATPILLVACGLVPVADLAMAQAPARNKPDIRRGYFGPQIDRTGAGSVVMLWVRPVEGGHDLLVARRAADGALEEPRLLNGSSGEVRHLPIDEARPVLATGPGDEVGIVWFDQSGRVRANLSGDGGRTFAGPFTLDGSEGRPENAFAGASIGRDGHMHVVWLDARSAPVDHEEPAHLFHARVTLEGASGERDLTSAHTTSVCGCCRPAVRVHRGGIEIVFRNTDGEGWRDVHRIMGTFSGDFGAPERIGPATWKIAACPMSGPIPGEGTVLWRDGSAGRPRIVSGTTPTAALGLVIDAERSGWTPHSPRWVPTDDGSDPLLLVPGEPDGRVLARIGGRWEVVVPDLPAWCASAIVLQGQLLMVGDEHGRLRLEALDVAW